MAKKRAPMPTHVLQNEEQLIAISRRIKRAHGQLGAISKMIDEGRSCEDIVMQMAAVGKAINTAAITLISASLKECIESGDSDDSVLTDKLQKLFLSFA